MRASFLAVLGNHQEAGDLLAPLLTAEYRDHHTTYSIGAAHAQLELSLVFTGPARDAPRLKSGIPAILAGNEEDLGGEQGPLRLGQPPACADDSRGWNLAREAAGLKKSRAG